MGGWTFKNKGKIPTFWKIPNWRGGCLERLGWFPTFLLVLVMKASITWPAKNSLLRWFTSFLNISFDLSAIFSRPNCLAMSTSSFAFKLPMPRILNAFVSISWANVLKVSLENTNSFSIRLFFYTITMFTWINITTSTYPNCFIFLGLYLGQRDNKIYKRNCFNDPA